MSRMNWEDNASRHVAAKRELGTGRWDRILRQRLVILSDADNYDEAKYEWKATGKCWWARNSQRNVPDWVAQTGHVGECLCGHGIVYHFGIKNTVNGNVDVVGSDHITSYLILREITESQNITESEVTEAMIQQWIDVRVKAMKAESWWEEKGEKFERDFNLVKDADLRINILETQKTYFDKELKMNRPVTKIRKRSQGEIFDDDYRMASIVWRWNHPDNPKNQQTRLGYADDKLVLDIMHFKRNLETHLETMALTEGRLLSDRQASTLLKIVNRQSDSATEKQINYLRRLGYTGDYALLTKKTASVEIDLLRNNNE